MTRAPLSELQLSMLLHSMSAPEEGSYVVQCSIALPEPVDAAALATALRELVAAHPALRTVFDADDRCQVVVDGHRPELIVENWCAFPQESRARHLSLDKYRPFDFAAPPVRYLLARSAPDRYEFFLTVHHAVADGRSLAVLITELVSRYDAGRAGTDVAVERRPPYSEYLTWLSEQDFTTSESFWREHLRGSCAAPRLGADRPAVGPSHATVGTRLPAQVGSSLEALSRATRIPVSAFVHGAWAVLLSHYLGCADVVFGATRSCRSGPPGVASMVGLLVNTLPQRAAVEPTDGVVDFVRDLRDRHRPLSRHEHTPLGLIRDWSGLPTTAALFESIVVYEDFAVDRLLGGQGGRWANVHAGYRDQVGVPVTLNAHRDRELALSVTYERKRFTDTAATGLLAHLVDLLTSMVNHPDRTVGELPRPADAAVVAAASDEFWARRLLGLRPLRLPHELPVACRATDHETIGVDGDCELADVVGFLARISGRTEDFDVGYRGPTGPPVLLRAPAFPPAMTRETHRAAIVRELAFIGAHPTCGEDIWAHDPRLRDNQATELARAGLPVVVEVGGEPSDRPRPGTAVSVWLAADGSRTQWRFSADHFPPDTGPLLTARFAAYLASAERDPLTDADRAAVLSWNDTQRPYPNDRCVHQLVTEQGLRTPDAPAVRFGDDQLTYRDLDRRTADLAAYLTGLGAGPGALVGVYLHRSADLVVTLLGVLRSGAAYVPLDPTYPRARIHHMVADAGLAMLVTEPELVADVEDCRPTVVVPAADRTRIDAYGGRAVADRATPADLAYVIYTSGSSGRPKGVRIGHRALTNFLCSMADRPGCGPGDHLLAVTTACFDIAGLELYLPLIRGATVEVSPAELAADGFALRRHLERVRPTIMQATPATWHMLRTAGWAGDQRLRVLCGGEALPPDLATYLVDGCAQVWNMYGPTETTIWSSVDRIRPGAQVTIGRPIANTEFHVLDPSGHPVPPGTPGELFIGGDGVADGYLNRPELTSSRFVPGPPDGRSRRVYRTGDLVQHLPDGRLTYLNRLDDQVKVHGHRIELGEIAARLRAHDAVRDAVAVVREDTPGDRRIVAYLVGAGIPASAALRTWAARELPQYMVPSAFVSLDAIPQTANGKVDRAALPAPVVTDTGFAPPRSAAEATVARIWREVLGGGVEVGLDAGFFELGGNSLLAMEVVRRLRAEFSVAVTPVDMFSHPTVRAMSHHLGASDGNRPGRRRHRQRDGGALADLRARRAALHGVGTSAPRRKEQRT